MKRFRPFDDGGQFQLSAGSLRSRAIRSAGATLLASGVGLTAQMASTMILARILTPDDFGVVTMVTTFSLLLSNVGFNGFTEGVLQREDLSHRLASNLFWLNVAIGGVLTVAFASTGPLLAWLYGSPRVVSVTIGVSFSIILSSTWVMHSALLRRAMRFAAVSTIDVTARVLAIITSIALALAGWEHWALVAGVLCVPLATTVGAWTVCRWTPGLPTRVAGTTSMIQFASNVYGRFMVNYGARNVDNLLVGWRFGPQALGLFKKAYDLFALSSDALIAPLSHVAVAALSRLTDDAPEYKRYLLRALGVIAFVGMGLGAMLTVSGDEVIRLVLGPQWEEAETIFRLFGPGIGIMQLYAIHGWIHVSLGRPDRWLRWGFVELAITGLLFLLLLREGPQGIALAWTLSFWILVIPALWYAGRPVQLEVKSLVATVWKYAVASAVSGYVCLLMTTAVGLGGRWAGNGVALGAMLRLFVICSLFGVLYLTMVVIIHRDFDPLYQCVRLVREMMPSRPGMRSSSSVAVER